MTGLWMSRIHQALIMASIGRSSRLEMLSNLGKASLGLRIRSKFAKRPIQAMKPLTLSKNGWPTQEYLKRDSSFRPGRTGFSSTLPPKRLSAYLAPNISSLLTCKVGKDKLHATSIVFRMGWRSSMYSIPQGIFNFVLTSPRILALTSLLHLFILTAISNTTKFSSLMKLYEETYSASDKLRNSVMQYNQA